MSEKKKHSGFFYRKRKLEIEKEKKKQASALKRFITVSTGPSTSTSSEEPTLAEKFGHEEIQDTHLETSLVSVESSESSCILTQVSKIILFYRFHSK